MPDPIEPTVTADGVEYPLSAYPAAQLEFLDKEGFEDEAEQASELETYGYPPAEAIQEIAHEYQKSKALADGRLVRGYVIGRVYEATIAVGPGRMESTNLVEQRNGDLVLDDKFHERLAWLAGKAGYFVWWQRADTGDGILLDDTIYMVAFSNQHLEANFLQRFPEVVR